MRRLSMAVAAAALTLWAAVAAAPGQSNGGEAARQEVIIKNFRFEPPTLTIPAGTSVVWVNRDDEPHRVASTDKSFAASPVLDTGERYSVKFAKSGTYDYFCSIHPKMVGKIVVK